jgi:uncharacterized membrane protein YczE
MTKTKTKPRLGAVIAVMLFGVFFVANLILAHQTQYSKANAVYIYQEPAGKIQ